MALVPGGIAVYSWQLKQILDMARCLLYHYEIKSALIYWEAE